MYDNTQQIVISILFVLVAVGFFCAGIAVTIPTINKWKIRWIELEHDSARKLGVEPRDINETFK